MSVVTPIYDLVAEDGTLHQSAMDLFLRRVSRFAKTPIEIIVRRRRTQRSLEQNKYLHGVAFPIMADYIGQGIAETKLDLMGECWGWTTTKLGHVVPVKPSTSAMSVDECSHFIDWLLPWAMTEHGVYIPPPEKVDGAA